MILSEWMVRNHHFVTMNGYDSREEVKRYDKLHKCLKQAESILDNTISVYLMRLYIDLASMTTKGHVSS